MATTPQPHPEQLPMLSGAIAEPQQTSAAGCFAVLIPARRVEPALEQLIEQLQQSGVIDLVLVDDGSPVADQPTFARLAALPGVHLLQHPVNCGKGRALKTGLAYFNSHLCDKAGVVTVDADGQHAVADVLRVMASMQRFPDRAVFGCRNFDRNVPLRSRLGNLLTRVIFQLFFRHKIVDTQTGLRGIPATLVPELLQIQGERYEYESAVLFWLCTTGREPREIPIETIYLNHNSASSFRPIRDSLRIYAVLLRLWVLKLLDKS